MTTAAPISAPRVAVIHPRLDGHGGLEKYGVYVIRALVERLGPGVVDVVSEHVVDPERVARAFNVRLDGVRFVHDSRCNPVLPTQGGLGARVERSKLLRAYEQLTGRYDFIIGQTVNLPYRSGARRSVLLCHFPVVRGQRVRPEVPYRGIAALTTSAGREQSDIRARLDSWTRIVSNSAFTAGWVKQYWARDSTVINPPIELPDLAAVPGPAASEQIKERWIVGAGFFGKPDEAAGQQWSYKRQELLIKSFKHLCDSGLSGWELHLAGHVLPPTPDVWGYVHSLQASAAGYPVFLHPDCPHSELMDLFRRGAIFWHATGYGIDPAAAPERLEHFGMSTVEAMGWGVVPVVIGLGGQPEIVEHDRSGFLWSTPEEMEQVTAGLIEDPARRQSFARAARTRAEDFGLDHFHRRLSRLLDEELAALRGARSALCTS